jgi:NAD+ kinase
MNKIARVGFVIKPHAPGVEILLNELTAHLEAAGLVCVLEKAAAEKIGLSRGLNREEIPEKTDLIVVLGGDGTLLSIAHIAARTGVPVMGVNLGRLGFLTEIPRAEALLTLDALLAGRPGLISPRRLIEVRSGDRVHHCLNDVVVNKGAMSRMVQIGIRIDGPEIAVLKADGLIISTPTGSTAYSLSAGGPIIQPHVPAIVISPICPHTLTFRPMVVSAASEIDLELITDGEEVHLTFDGQRSAPMEKNHLVRVRNSELELSLVTSPRRNYFDLVKEKLGWAG